MRTYRKDIDAFREIENKSMSTYGIKQLSHEIETMVQHEDGQTARGYDT
jgi:hypothetical protein